MRATSLPRHPADAPINLTPRPVRTLVRDRDRAPEDQWSFTLDPTRTETIDERRARYLADNTLVNLYGIAAISGRAWSTLKRLNFDSNVWRRQLRNLSPVDERRYDELLDQRLILEQDITDVDTAAVEVIAAELRAMDARRAQAENYVHLDILREHLLNGLPEAYADGPQWTAQQIYRAARKLRWLDAWYEPVRKTGPGRKPGSKNKNRRTTKTRTTA